MIRFIDLTEDYFTDASVASTSICAFLSTIDDRFLETDMGQHTFNCPEDINLHPQRDRLWRLTPQGFFDRNYTMPRGLKRIDWFFTHDNSPFVKWVMGLSHMSVAIIRLSIIPLVIVAGLILGYLCGFITR